MGFANGINNMPRWQGNFPVSLRTGNHTFRLSPVYRDSLNPDVADLAVGEAATANFFHEEGQWRFDVSYNWQVTPEMNVAFQALDEG